jgi:hypothetical protein
MGVSSYLSNTDIDRIIGLLGGGWREPDVDIQPDGTPYLYRWHLIPRNAYGANAYLHVQVASDPERPLHDHPWDNQSVILAGGYIERQVRNMPWGIVEEPRRFAGQTISRKAEEAHRLILPPEVPYTMTLFTTGPVRRDWGFWLNDHRGYPTWLSHEECLVEVDGGIQFKRPERIG